MATGPTLVGAIVATFRADTGPDSLMALVPSGIWVGEVPEKYQLPIVALRDYGQMANFNTQNPYYVDGRVQFEVRAAPLATAETIAARILFVFDQDVFSPTAQIDITDATCTRFMRTEYRVDVVRDRTSADQPVYSVTISYVSTVNQTLPTRT